jgi:predicted nucleic acid-binding protein
MNEFFVDTGYLLALELGNDQNHEAAQKYWQQIIVVSVKLLTTTYILNEVVTYLNSRDHHAKAVQIGEILLNSTTIELVHVDEALLQDSWAYFRQHQDKRYSLTDCVSLGIAQEVCATET